MLQHAIISTGKGAHRVNRKPAAVIRRLQKDGWQEVKSKRKGSHRHFVKDGQFTEVPIHKGRDINPYILKDIAKKAGWKD